MAILLLATFFRIVLPGAAFAADAGIPLTISELLRGMRSASGVVAEFTETKQLALLSSPLEARGVIYFLPPDRLVREVSSPGHSRLVVDGDKVRFDDEAGQKAMDLSASPIARQMVDSFVVLFNGDEARLNELYKVEFRADGGSAWHLRLEPHSMPLNRMISSFELSGDGPHIDRMEMAEPDGDRTVTVFGKTEVDHRFGTDELAALFGALPAR
jgi:hypothetical protein